MTPAGVGWPNLSRLTMVELPGTELLSQDNGEVGAGVGAVPVGLQPRKHASLLNGMRSFARVVAQLAQQPYPERIVNYRYLLKYTQHNSDCVELWFSSLNFIDSSFMLIFLYPKLTLIPCRILFIITGKLF